MKPTTRPPLSPAALDQLFVDAHTYFGWSDRGIDDDLIRQLYDTLRWAPTATNSNPGRFVFVQSGEGKERLRPHLAAKNVDQTMTAACCVIVAEDVHFYEFMDKLIPQIPLRELLAANPDYARTQSLKNSIIQGAYLVLAARALGLDVGPMQGFDNETLDADFFPDGRWRSNFLVNLGYGAPEGHRPRNPRLDFDEACRTV